MPRRKQNDRTIPEEVLREREGSGPYDALVNWLADQLNAPGVAIFVDRGPNGNGVGVAAATPQAAKHLASGMRLVGERLEQDCKRAFDAMASDRN